MGQTPILEQSRESLPEAGRTEAPQHPPRSPRTHPAAAGKEAPLPQRWAGEGMDGEAPGSSLGSALLARQLPESRGLPCPVQVPTAHKTARGLPGGPAGRP